MADASDSGDVEVVEVVVDSARDQIVEQLRADLGDGVLDVYLVAGVDLWIRVTADAWPLAAAALKNRGFDFFDFLSAIDWMPSPFGNSETDPFAEVDDVAEADLAGEALGEELTGEMAHGYTGGETRFQLFARFSNLTSHLGVTIKADVPDSLEMPTIIPSFAGANWHEREAHEMYGIVFVDHPDLRNLYLPSEFEGHPLRKDFPLLARHIKPWPGIVDVEPMAGGDDE